MKKLKVSCLAILLLLFLNNQSFAQWQTHSQYGFKINIPSNWSKTNYMDGTDKVFDYMSPDENAAVQLRVFDAGIDFTTDLLAQVYEESMLPAGTQKLSLNEYTTVNGIPCKKGVYLLDYNGNEVGLSAIYIVQNNKGYVLTALIPSNMIQQKGEELKGVTNSFSIDGFQAPSNTAEKEKKPSGLGGLMGGTTQNNNSSGNSGVEKNEVTISGNSVNGTYYFSKSGSYPIKWNETVVIRGLDDSGTNALELYLYNNKGAGTFTYGAATNSNATFSIGAINGKGVKGGSNSPTGQLTITEYKEGGMIKGHFTAHVNGHDIKGSFSLPLSTPKGYGGNDL
jgi:hypothetical protein